MSTVFFSKQKTAYAVRISDWSADVCSSDLIGVEPDPPPAERCIVPVAGQFERGHAAHVHWYFQQGLERKRRNLPAHRAAIPGFRAPVRSAERRAGNE